MNPQSILALLLQFKPAELEAMYAILDTASDEVGRALEEATDEHHAELEAQAAVIAKLHQLHQLLMSGEEA